MRDNLIFCGIDEDGEQTLDEKLYTIIEDELNLNDINIVRCHRLPKPKRDRSDDKPRNVVAKFADHADVQSILPNARRLKGREHHLYIYQQYPKEIVARRRILQPILHAAKVAKIKATLVDDRLYLDGSLYTVDNIADIPFDTTKLNERRNESTVALGRLSPLKNFCSSPFVVDQTEVYSCVEQYFSI